MNPQRAPGIIAARERNCYCSLWDKDPAFCQAQGYAPGHCGVCDRCGVPGHTRHFPGPLPYTGSWCDRCYRIVKWTLAVPVGRWLAPGVGGAWRLPGGGLPDLCGHWAGAEVGCREKLAARPRGCCIASYQNDSDLMIRVAELKRQNPKASPISSAHAKTGETHLNVYMVLNCHFFQI